MTSISLGSTPDGRAIALDLDALLAGRLLIQGNSGAGKSWVLRRLGEQGFGAVPIIIIDPEGEFATLRERYGYVLVGKGGETPADLRSAGLVAQKLLELRASAVCDLFEVKADERHEWVRLFLEAMMEAPKKYWRPTLVVVDEAHLFAPERGFGDSTAKGAMVDLATRGRKRGFCPVWATQRLGKLDKTSAAELRNVLVGGTFMDIDQERAADALGVRRSERPDFLAALKRLDSGAFWGLGRAIAIDRLLIKIGPVATTHPEAGSMKHASEPPPPPELVKALLPKLADLPKTAEEKAQTEKDLRAEIRTLREELRARPSTTVEKAVEKRIEVAVLKDSQVKRLEVALAQLAKVLEINREGLNKALLKLGDEAGAINAVGERAAAVARELEVAIKAKLALPPPVTHGGGHVGAAQPFVVPYRRSGSPDGTVLTTTQNAPAGPDAKILWALARFRLLGVLQVRRPLVAAVAKTSPNSSRFDGALRRLRDAGHVAYPADGVVALTPDGAAAAPAVGSAPTKAELLDGFLSILDAGCGRLLSALVKAYPSALPRADLAAAAGTSPKSSRFDRALRVLRDLGVATYPEPGSVRAAEILFV